MFSKLFYNTELIQVAKIRKKKLRNFSHTSSLQYCFATRKCELKKTCILLKF